MIKFNSIQTRLVVAVVSLSAAIVGCFASFSYWQVNAGLKESFQSQALVIMSPFYKSVARELPEGNDDLNLFVRVQIAAKGASMFPELVRVHADLQGLMFLEADGNVLRQEGKCKDLPKSLYQSVNIGAQTFEKIDAGTVFVTIPFDFHKQNLGSTVLRFSTERIAAQERRIMRAAIVVFLFFLITGSLGAVAVARSIVSPIVNLAEKIGEGKISGIDLEMTREDEVGVFSRSFGHMREVIQNQMGELNTEIVVRERAENELRETFDRSLLQQEAICQLSVDDALRMADFKAAASVITKATADALGVHRVSLWLLEEGATVLRCLDLYDSSAALHSCGDVLAVSDFPLYFSEMMKMETVAISEVLSDSRSAELLEGYFKPHGITSTIDTGLQVEGKIIGIICCENIGVRRDWKPDEITFVSRVADQASLALTTSRRIKAETARQRSEEDLRITLNSIGDAVIATDALGVITRMNPVAEQLTGWSIEAALGRRLSDVYVTVSEESGDRCKDPIARVILTDLALNAESQCVLVARDNSERKIADSGAPICNDSGEVVGVVLVFRDVTKQTELEQQSRQAEKMQAVGQLAGGVAHDFNNMLAGILGASELLSFRLGKDDKSRNLLNTIFQASRSAADLVNKLMVFSRKGKSVTQLVDINSVLDDAVSILERSIDKRVSLKISNNADHKYVSGDPSLLQNAILNLALNARDALPDGGNIHITADNVELDEIYCKANSFDVKPGLYLKISVQDDGVGIPIDLQRKIFEPFFTTKVKGKGTGLGLSAVYGTVSDHHGAITVYSEIETGTTFNLYLPTCSEEGHSQPSSNSMEIMGGSGVILIIDDEEIVRVTASGMLEKLGYEVLIAENGEEGVSLFAQNINRIDVVILDMVMPTLSGTEVFRRIRKLDNNAKIIIASGFSHDDSISILQDEGLSAFLKKPFSLASLNETVRNVMFT